MSKQLHVNLEDSVYDAVAAYSAPCSRASHQRSLMK